eukprot:8538581-Alexandrium_andersonii.AAC.1
MTDCLTRIAGRATSKNSSGEVDSPGLRGALPPGSLLLPHSDFHSGWDLRGMGHTMSGPSASSGGTTGRPLLPPRVRHRRRRHRTGH